MTDSPNKKITFPNSSINIKIISKLKQTQYSKVLLVQDTLNSNQHYILKIIRASNNDKSELNSINNETILLNYLKNNSNIIKLLDYFFQDNSKESFFYLLLEYYENGNLYDMINKLNAQNNCFSDSQIWKCLYDIAKGLKSVHSLKYTHRNLKTENIVLGNDGSYKLCGFYHSTNKTYDVVNNSNRNEVILDISKFTSSNIRAPEQLDTYAGYNLNEKVDIWALGIILYNMLFDNQPFCDTSNDQIKGNFLLTDDMMKNSNPKFIYLLRNMTNPNPKDRISADEILFFIEKNWDKFKTVENIIPIKKKTSSFIGKMSDATIKLFKRNSTEFWVLKLTDKDLNPPKIKYIKCLLEKAWKKKFKISKFYDCIARRPVHYLSTVALKSLYVIHSYLLYGPTETLNINDFNFQEYFGFFINLWNQRAETTNYDEDDILKNHNISKFICFYGDYLLKKHLLHKKYMFLENNFSLENTISNNQYFDFAVLIEKNFLKDLITIFNNLNSFYAKVPITVSNSNMILDQIIQIISDELHFMFILIFFCLIAYKNNIIKEKNDNLLKEYDSVLFDIIGKIKDNTDKYKKFRTDIKSKLIFYSIPANINEFIINMNNNLKLFPNLNFNIKQFFLTNKEINGSKLQRSYGKLIEISKPISQLNENEGKRTLNKIITDNSSLNNNDQINQKFEFSNDKFKHVNTNFDFEGGSNYVRRNSNDFVRCNTINASSLNVTNNIQVGSNTNSPNLDHSNYTYNMNNQSFFNNYSNNKPIFDYNLYNMTNNNLNQNRNLNIQRTSIPQSSNNANQLRNFKESVPIRIETQHNLINNASANTSYSYTNQSSDKTTSNLNCVKKEDPFTTLYNQNSNGNFGYASNKQNSFNEKALNQNINNILNDIFDSNPKREISDNNYFKGCANKSNNNFTSKQIDDTDKLKNILTDLDHIYKNIRDSKAINQPNQKSIFVDGLDNTLKANNLNSLLSPRNQGNEIKNEAFNVYTNQSVKENKQENNIYKNEVSNINIYNIQNNINNIELEKIANSFLFQELSKGNLHWLISSKDIKMEKQIGYGGSSEVYKANYRGTDVAVKKLRILDVKEENLKEFKREVSSLIMLRHPNLVLFMGAIAEKDNICIVTEYCAGGTLFSILHQRKDMILTWELRLRILLEIAIGMNFLHTNNPPIIHRDLKSLNILLTEKIEKPTDNTKIKISDFGLSKIIKQFDNERDKMTGQLGTCHWMAPEVIDNKQYSLKADVYSYGIIIWEICSRRTPYSDMNHQQISYYVTVKKGRPDKTALPSNTPQPLIKLMENCWDEEQNNRPSFAQIISFLKKLL